MATTILPLHFKLLTWLSAWCLEHWPSRIKFMYRIYSLIMFTSLLFMNTFQLAKLLFEKWETFIDFNNVFSYNIGLQAVVLKAGTFLFNQDKIVQLISMFEKDYCLVRDEFERNICKAHENRCINIAKVGFLILELLSLSFVTTPLTFDAELRILPYPVLLPYSLQNLWFYWLTYANQVINCIYVGHVSLLADLVATGFMWHLCGQLEILKHRLRKLGGNITQSDTVSSKRQIVKECVQHHVHLYNIADAIYAAFSVYIVFQFYCDALSVCMSVYQLTTMTSHVVEKLAFLWYLGITTGRLYLVCYFGNEVVLQSENLADAIFEIDWTPFSTDLKKSLLIMILRSSKPIIVSSRFFVRLMLETFIKVVKVSYSGYNLLKSTV